MTWILVAMVVVWVTLADAMPTNDQRTNLLNVVNKLEEKLKRYDETTARGNGGEEDRLKRYDDTMARGNGFHSNARQAGLLDMIGKIDDKLKQYRQAMEVASRQRPETRSESGNGDGYELERGLYSNRQQARLQQARLQQARLQQARLQQARLQYNGGERQKIVENMSELFSGMSGSDGGMSGSDGGMSGSDGGMSGSDGGMSGSDGGMSGSDGGMYGSDGGMSGSDGGMSGSDGGMSGSDGGMYGSDDSWVSGYDGAMSGPDKGISEISIENNLDPGNEENIWKADFMTTVEKVVDFLPESTSLVSNLMPDQIAEAIARVTSTVIKKHVPEHCQHFVSMGLFMGSVKQTLELEYNPDLPNSLYDVISRWASVALPRISHGAPLNSSVVFTVVDMFYRPFLSWIGNFARNVGTSEIEKNFFDAVRAAIQSTQSSCSRTRTTTLRTTIVQLFKYTTGLDLFSGRGHCPDISTLIQGVEKLITNMGTYMKDYDVHRLLSEVLTEPEIDSIMEYMERKYNLPDILHLVFHLSKNADYDNVIRNISDGFTGIYFVRIIEGLTMDQESGDIMAAIMDQYSDVDLFALHVKMATVERRYILTSFIEGLLVRLHNRCPGVALSEVFLGFIHYAVYNLPSRSQLSSIIAEISQQIDYNTDALYGYHYFSYILTMQRTVAGRLDSRDVMPGSDRGGRRYTEGVSPQNVPTPLTNIYDFIYLIQKVILGRIDSHLEPILDKIDVDSAEALFWNIENQLFTEDPDQITLYQLLRDIEDAFLGYTTDMESRVCGRGTNTLSELRTVLKSAVPRLLKPVKPDDIYSVYTPTGSAAHLTLRNVSTILKKLEQYLLPERISLGLIRVADIVRSDSISDVQGHLASEITSIIDDILRVTVDDYNPYEIDEPTEGLPLEYTIDELFQQRKDDMMQSLLVSNDPIDALSDFFILFVQEARRRGLETEPFLEILKEVLDSIVDTSPSL